MVENQGPERGFSLDTGKLSPSLIKALRLITDEMSMNNVPAEHQARLFGRAYKATNRYPAARLEVSPFEIPVDLGRAPVDHYDLIAAQFGIVLIRDQRRVIASE